MIPMQTALLVAALLLLALLAAFFWYKYRSAVDLAAAIATSTPLTAGSTLGTAADAYAALQTALGTLQSAQMAWLGAPNYPNGLSQPNPLINTEYPIEYATACLTTGTLGTCASQIAAAQAGVNSVAAAMQPYSTGTGSQMAAQGPMATPAGVAAWQALASGGTAAALNAALGGA